MRRRNLAFPLLAAVILAALPAAAQVNVSRWTSFKPLPEGAVDRSDLDLHLEFPIFNRATVGRAQVQAVLVYDSQFWQPVSGAWHPQAGNGWWLRTSAGHLSETSSVDYGACGWTDGSGGDDGSGSITEYDFTFVEPDGTSAFGASYISVDAPYEPHTDAEWNDCPSSDSLPISNVIGDGKGYQVVIDSGGDGTAWDAYGDNLTDGLTDTNNNSVSSSAGVWSDPLGTAVTISGSGTVSSPLVYTYTGSGSTAVSVTENFESIYATAGFGCYSGYGGYLTVPEALTYPDGSEYVFSYDSAGRLASVTLPTGGVLSYAYSYSIGCSSATETLTRSESLDPGEEWLWSNSSSASSDQTVETSPDGNDTVFDFSGGALTEADAYQGTYSFGTEISQTTVATTYSSGNITKTATTELFGSTPLYSVHANSYSQNNGFPTGSSDNDWSTSASGGGLLREEVDAYGTSGNADVLTSRTVSDASGQVSKSTYAYGSRANLETEEDYVTGSVYLSKSYTYNTNGTVATATDVNGGVTTYTYGTNGTCTGIFPTEIKGPIAAALDTTMTWDCHGGLLLSSTDVNGQATTTTYDDPDHTWRPTLIVAADGSHTVISYPAVGQVERAMSFNGGTSATDVLTTLDALGRSYLSQRRQTPTGSSFDTVTTFYDAMGRRTGATLPCSATAGHSCGTQATTMTYDALSRLKKATDAGGGETDYSYPQNDVLTTVAGSPDIVRQEEMDGMGRLSSVCEVTTAGGSAACGQTAAETGYLTTYVRSGLGKITSVTQNAQAASAAWESRSFAFDQLGRLTSETNPESGTSSYTFDTDLSCGTSDGDLVKRYDANGNTTCYAYDALHRVTAISYPSGPNSSATPTKTFVYDAATVDGGPMANAGGRLAEAYTGSHATDLGFSYDPGADTETVYQDSPNSGGWYATTAASFPNGSLNTLSVPGAPLITYGADGEGRPTTATAAGTPPQPLVSAASYNAAGRVTGLTLGSSDSDGYSYDASTGRMTQYQFTVDGATDTGALGWNANGTLGTLAITDDIAGTADSQSCSYGQDDLGRLATVACTGGSGWSQTFTYDAFGNLAKSGTQSFGASYVDGGGHTSNRIVTDISFAPNYDSDGNLEDDPVSATRSVNSYDAEGKAVTLEEVGVTYDALGRAVEAAETGGRSSSCTGRGGVNWR